MSAINFWVASAKSLERDGGVLEGGRPARRRWWDVTASGILGPLIFVAQPFKAIPIRVVHEAFGGRVGEGGRWNVRLERSHPFYSETLVM